MAGAFTGCASATTVAPLLRMRTLGGYELRKLASQQPCQLIECVSTSALYSECATTALEQTRPRRRPVGMPPALSVLSHIFHSGWRSDAVRFLCDCAPCGAAVSRPAGGVLPSAGSILGQRRRSHDHHGYCRSERNEWCDSTPAPPLQEGKWLSRTSSPS